MPRNNRRRRDEPAGPPYAGGEISEDWLGVSYVVRKISGSSSAKNYRCPGCDQQIRPVTPHVVAWPEQDTEAADRRHWHTACWAARANRAPRVQRARDAPRY